MKELHEKIQELSDGNVARLAIWIFNMERKQHGGAFATARLNELNSPTIQEYINSKLSSWDIKTIENRPDDKIIVETFRLLLLDYAEQEPQTIKDRMKGLHLDAGGFDLTEILQGLDISYISLLILFLLKPHFKISYKNGNFEFEFSFGSSEGIIKELFNKLPMFKD
jgi:hypothetical protein